MRAGEASQGTQLWCHLLLDIRGWPEKGLLWWPDATPTLLVSWFGAVPGSYRSLPGPIKNPSLFWGNAVITHQLGK